MRLKNTLNDFCYPIWVGISSLCILFSCSNEVYNVPETKESKIASVNDSIRVADQCYLLCSFGNQPAIWASEEMREEIFEKIIGMYKIVEVDGDFEYFGSATIELEISSKGEIVRYQNYSKLLPQSIKNELERCFKAIDYSSLESLREFYSNSANISIMTFFRFGIDPYPSLIRPGL